MADDKPNSKPRKQIIDEKEVRRLARRGFLKAVAGSVAGLTAVEAGIHYGGNAFYKNYLQSFEDRIRYCERFVQEGIIEIVEALTNSVQKNLDTQVTELKEHYDRTITYWKGMEILPPEDARDLEERLRKFEEQAKDAQFWSRMSELSDQIDHKLLTIEREYESKLPGPMQKAWNFFRDLHGYGGEEGQKKRDAIFKRLDNLVQVYSIRRDSKIAQTEVVKKINGYLRSVRDLTPEERQLYQNLLSEAKKDGGSQRVKDFILGYDKSRVDIMKRQAYSDLSGWIQESQKLYETRIKQEVQYLKKLQETYDEAKQVQVEIKTAKEADIGRIETRVEEVSKQADEIKAALEEVGYKINYEKSIGFEILPAVFKGVFDTGKYAIMGIVGGLGLSSLWRRRKEIRLKVRADALQAKAEEFGAEAEDLAAENKSLRGQLEKYQKGPDDSVSSV